jgi:acetyl coenzyme A synthetase (ADP forming)-like protein
MERSTTLDAIMRPRSIAVVGASRSANTIGYQIVSNLVRHGFTGAVYPINPKADSVSSIRAWKSISDLPEPVDQAVIVVPKQYVLDVAEECGRAGVKGLIVITAGFKEVGGEGIERERQLMEVVRRHGMRMVGPNCMGVLNVNPDLSMNGTFAPMMPPLGKAAFVSQSGALGASVLDYAAEFGIGISQFVSVGNKPNISGNDLLTYWEDDPTVGLILMYVENFGNPRNFLTIASRVTRKKPIIIVKAGRSKAGARAASSHTGALAASDASVEALIRQAGVIRAGSIEEMFDLASAFTDRPLPKGRRTVVLTNGGGPGILATDALSAHGLDVVDLKPETLAQLQPMFAEEASIRNPIDMIASANPPGYRAAMNILLEDDTIDNVLTIFVPPLGVKQEEVAEAIGKAAEAHPDKPVRAVLMGRSALPAGRAQLHRVNVPSFIFPESAALALSILCRQSEHMSRPYVPPPIFDVDRERAAAILDRAAASGVEKLDELDALELLESYGIKTARGRLARSAEEAMTLASEIGGTVVMKVVSPQVVHKSDVGGVVVGVETPAEAAQVFVQIHERVLAAVPEAEIEGILVQPMIAGGRETIIGVAREPNFGPMLMFGLGGIFVEVLKDVCFRIAPITRYDAEVMVHGIRGARVLKGVRGEPASDIEAVIEALLRVSQLADENPSILELDINPLLARTGDAVAVDARVRVAVSGADASLTGEPAAILAVK